MIAFASVSSVFSRLSRPDGLLVADVGARAEREGVRLLDEPNAVSAFASAAGSCVTA